MRSTALSSSGDVYPGGVMLAVFTEQVGKIALSAVGTKVHANVLLQFSFLWKGSGNARTVFHMEKAHFEALVRSLLLLFFLAGLFVRLFTFGLVRSFRCLSRFIDGDRNSGDNNTIVLNEHGAHKRRDLFRNGIVLNVIVHYFPELHCKFDHNDYVADIQFFAGGAVLNKIGVNTVLGEECQVSKKLVNLGHEKHVQMREQMRIAHIPAGDFFIFDELNHLICILVEQRLSFCNVDDC
jgi:hypothetical protein